MLGLNSGVNVKLYSDIRFDSKQMQLIRKGLENGVDVSTWAKPEIPATLMQRFMEVK